jgi:predicted alpha/beta-fold hydrolase
LLQSSTCKPFTPAFGLSNKHLQTIFPTFFRKEKSSLVDIEQFELSDGDFVDCYWNSRSKLVDGKAIVVLFHGLAGSFTSPYIQGIMNQFEFKGFTSVLMHFRGCSGCINRLPRSYHSGDTGDAKEWLEHLKRTYPSSPIYAVGYSLGGNMLLKFLGEYAKLSLIQKAVSVSAPMQLDISADKMNKGFSKFYQQRLLKDLKSTLIEKYKYHDMKSLIGIDKNEVENLNSFWKFDDAYTAPIHGFDSAKDYYKKSSSKQFLKDIKTDTLIIHALDDPFMTPDILPTKEELSDKVHLEVYPHGGHVGFVSKSVFSPTYWLDERILNFFNL